MIFRAKQNCVHFIITINSFHIVQCLMQEPLRTVQYQVTRWYDDGESVLRIIAFKQKQQRASVWHNAIVHCS